MNNGTSRAAFLETDVFVEVILDFCQYLLIFMIIWLLFLVIRHYIRRVSFGRMVVSVGKGLTEQSRQGDLSSWKTEVHYLRDRASSLFSHNNTRTLSVQLIGALFILGMFLYRVIAQAGAVSLVSLVPLVIVGLFGLFSMALYFTREKQGDRALKEIEKLESLLAN